MVKELAVLPLAENDTTACEFELDVTVSKDDGSYMAVVDGKSVFERLKVYFQ